MLIDKIFEAMEYNEEEGCEAPSSHYEIEYDMSSQTMIMNFIENYYFDGDNWGEIEVKRYSQSIAKYHDTTVEEYINLLISILNCPEEYNRFVRRINFIPMGVKL